MSEGEGVQFSFQRGKTPRHIEKFRRRADNDNGLRYKSQSGTNYTPNCTF
jgi:hypothetical protein